MLTVYNIKSGDEYPLTCVWNLPRWFPDNEHFMYQLGSWYLGSISNNIYQPLDILNVTTDSSIDAYLQMIWLNKKFFLFVLQRENTCMLSIATLQGIVTQIASTPTNICPQGIDFSLPQ